MFEVHENNAVLDENSDEGKPCINRESKSDELTIQLYSCHNINIKLPAVVTQPSIYQYSSSQRNTSILHIENHPKEFLMM